MRPSTRRWAAFRAASPVYLILVLGCLGSCAANVAPPVGDGGPESVTPRFPTAVFANLEQEPVPRATATELQQALERAAAGDGVTASLISTTGTWSGATGLAAAGREMVHEAQLSIASITKTVTAAQVLQLVEAGRLALDDLAADHLPPDVRFDTNGTTIADLLAHRSGIRDDTLLREGEWESLRTDPRRSWSTEELLATVGPERDPVGRSFEYRGINYVLLGLIVEQVMGRPFVDVLRAGVLADGDYGRLVYQPDEPPTEPIAMPDALPSRRLDSLGGQLPSLATATAFNAEGAMASDAPTLARWFRSLCAGEIVSATSLDRMSDFDTWPEYALGLMDRSHEYGASSGAVGHTGKAPFGYTSAALCVPEQGAVVVVLSNTEHDVDTTARALVQAAATPSDP